jgi:hypothetical protein
MSRIAQRTPQIYVGKDNWDVYDTLAPIVENLANPRLPYVEGMVDDTLLNRVNGALACIYQLKKTITRLENRVRELEQ